jgi:putative ABC transport system permease protein
MRELPGEIRHAARRLLHAPAFTLPAILTLGLAIGANGAIFTVVQRVVLNPLPYPDSDGLIQVDHGLHGLNIPNGLGLTPGLYLHYAERARTIEGLAVVDTGEATLTEDGDPERIRVTSASVSLGPVLGVAPARGRWFSASEGAPGAARVVVLSHQLWARRYGSDPDIVGRTIRLDDAAVQVIGVMPPGFAFPESGVDAWTAATLTRATGFGLWTYDAVARRRSGVELADVRAELTALIADVARAFPNDPLALGQLQAEPFVNVTTLKDASLGNISLALWMLLAASGVVLLVACANVANLFLVRAEARQREVAVRRALGAGRGGIVRYFLTESALLSIAGSVIGFGLVAVGVRLLVAAGPEMLPRLDEIRVDGTVLAFVAGVATLTAIALGVMPLLQGSSLAVSLNEIGRSLTATRRGRRTRHVLMAAQMAMAVVLVVSSGLMVRSFQNLRAVDPGFDAGRALTFSIALPEQEYPTRAAGVIAHQAILDRLSSLPSVSHASAVSCLPFAGGCSGNTVRVEGRTLPPRTVPPLALLRAVAPGYFDAMGIRLSRGRTFTRAEIDRGAPVAIVSTAFADQIFPNEDAIGRRVASNLPPGPDGKPVPLAWLTIVGIVGDVPIRSLGAPAVPHLYMPLTIAGGPDLPRLIGPSVALMRYVLRSDTAPAALVPFVRGAIADVDSDLALADIRSLQAILDGASSQMAFTMVLIAIAAAVALTLGVVGIYGVVSYIVTRRTGEIGLRLALGARPRRVAAMIVAQSVRVAGAGVVFGIAAALAGGRYIESLLYGVSPRDPGVFLTATAALLTVALIACWIPARRAARLNPLQALRSN